MEIDFFVTDHMDGDVPAERVFSVMCRDDGSLSLVVVARINSAIALSVSFLHGEEVLHDFGVVQPTNGVIAEAYEFLSAAAQTGRHDFGLILDRQRAASASVIVLAAFR